MRSIIMENQDADNLNLPVRPGHTNFSKLIRQGDIYIDKTRIIQGLLSDRFDTVLLNRPRRFGKTLLLSTIEHILNGDREKFKTLDIGRDDSGYSWKSSHVIRLDMSKYGIDARTLDEDLSVGIRKIAKRLGVHLESVGSGPSLAELIEELYDNYKDIPLKRSDNDEKADIPDIAVLIDEYDFPFVMNFNYPKALRKIRKSLAAFYASLKSVSEKTRFVLITGITRFQEFTSFSGMNRFGDITFDPNYSTICGFTKKEIENNFQVGLSKAYESLKTVKSLGPPNSPDDILGLLMDWYDGYSWDGNNRVLNPISVLYFFDAFDFARYWYDTGAPSFLQELQIKDEDYFTKFSNNDNYLASITYPETKTISPESSLLATGYLTVGRTEGEIDGGYASKIYYLTVPNMEVRMSYAQDHLIPRLFPKISAVERTRFYNLSTKFCVQLCRIDADQSADYLSSIFAGIPYDYHTELESFYKSHMNTVLAFARGFLTAEKHSGEGRPDFVLETRHHVLVIEVKYAKSDDPYVNNTIDNRCGQDMNPQDDGYAKGSNDSDTVDTQCDDRNGFFDDLLQVRNQKWHGKERLLTILDNGITAALTQITDNGYALEYLDDTKKVWAVAVSILGRTGVKIKFQEVRRN
jgi:hypothetical protein